MLQPPKKFIDRVTSALKPLQTVAQTCQSKDINESDTVTLVMDILCDVLGYNKYGEVTKEHQIRSTYCDLAIELGGKIYLLIEVKAIGISLKENHIQQALNYAAMKGCEWVVLTNAVRWQLYRVVFGQPITSEVVLDLDLLATNPKKAADQEALYTLSREGADKNSLVDFHVGLQAKDRHCIAALLMTEPVLKLIRKEIRAMNPNVQLDVTEILDVIQNQIIKRDVLEGEKAVEAVKRIKKHQRKLEREKSKDARQTTETPASEAEDGSQVSGDGN